VTRRKAPTGAKQAETTVEQDRWDEEECRACGLLTPADKARIRSSDARAAAAMWIALAARAGGHRGPH
jgi:hypothetical protein